MRIYTEAQLKEIEDKGVVCPECKQKNLDQNYHKIRKNYCFSCNFWTDWMEDKKENIIRIDGNQYVIGKEPSENFRHKELLGFGGREFKIKKFDSDEIITTHNLWYSGEIPQHFRERMPNNADWADVKREWVEFGYEKCLADIK